MTDEESEILDVVDADDLVTGSMERGEIHRKRLYHRSVHVFLFDGAGRIYLQKRSLEKIEHPGKWDSSASGHVDSGESYQAAAARELEEEIGVKASPDPVLRIRASEETGMEHAVLFEVRSGPADPDPVPNPREVLEGRFFTRREIETGIAAERETFSPSFRLLYRLYRGQTAGGGA